MDPTSAHMRLSKKQRNTLGLSFSPSYFTKFCAAEHDQN